VLKEGIEKTGRFDIVSKDVGVPLVAFSLKDSSKYTVFQIAENLWRFGWILPAYTMPPNAQHIAVLRVVIREDFSRTLAERLVTDIDRVLKEMDQLPSHVSITAGHVTATVGETQDDNGGRKHVQKSVSETQLLEVINTWKRFVDRKRTGVC
jgi:glutamate decarboxylase